MPERDDLDRLIDSELARYADPRAGLEQRILTRVVTEGPQRFSLLRNWQRWAFVGVVAGAMVLAVGIQLATHRKVTFNTADATRPLHQVKPTTTVPDHHVPTLRSMQIPTTVHGTTRRSKAIEAAHTQRRPKLEVFPAPQPLSEEEQALLAIATARSDAARENLIASQHQLQTPLQISAIEIPPLDGRNK